MTMTKLGPIADRIAAKLGDIRAEPEWEDRLFDELQWANYGALDFKQTDIAFGMIVRRWDNQKEKTA